MIESFKRAIAEHQIVNGVLTLVAIKIETGYGSITVARSDIPKLVSAIQEFMSPPPEVIGTPVPTSAEVRSSQPWGFSWPWGKKK